MQEEAVYQFQSFSRLMAKCGKSQAMHVVNIIIFSFQCNVMKQQNFLLGKKWEFYFFDGTIRYERNRLIG
jgi:hypothetical protein